jgi:PKD repeat protein
MKNLFRLNSGGTYLFVLSLQIHQAKQLSKTVLLPGILVGLFFFNLSGQAVSPPTINVCDENQIICLTGPTHNLCVKITVQPGTPAIDRFEIKWDDGTPNTLIPGSQSPPNQSHPYDLSSFFCTCNASSFFTVTLYTYYVGDPDRKNNSFEVEFRNKPIPDFAYDVPTCRGVDIDINNTACENGANATYKWAWPNGQMSTLENPDITFNALGTYNVQLCVTNYCGEVCVTKPVTVIDRPHISQINATTANGCVPFQSKFTATQTGVATSGYRWRVVQSPNGCTNCYQFIPSTGTDSIMPVIRFTVEGTYVVQLIGSNECGNDTATVTINAAALPSLTPGNIPAGCNSLTVNFNDQLLDYGGTIQQYQWTFPTGASISTSSSQYPGNVTFTQTGTVTVELRGVCDTIFQSIPIVVNSQSPVAFGSIPPNLCTSSAPFNLSATPGGGSFMGTGITNFNQGTFSPNTAGVGTHTITYRQGVPGCESQGTITITVSAAPMLDIGPSTSLCRDDAPLALTANFTPGTWTGSGVSGGTQFDPALANIGANLVTYTHTTATGCIANATKTITVVAKPLIIAIDTIVSCNIPTAVNLVQLANMTFSPALPGSTVTWSGTGVDATGQFTSSGVGLYPVTVTYTIPPGCDTSKTFYIRVNDFVPAIAGPDTTLCTSQTTYTLQGSPVGGQWKNAAGTVVSNVINLTSGSFTYTYTIQSNTPCESTDEVFITVVGGNAVNAGPDLFVCETAPALNLNTPAGTTWTGPGIVGTSIDIPSLTPDVYTYILTNPALPENCRTDMMNVTVAAQPSADFNAPDTACVGQVVTLIPVSTPGVQYQIDWGDGSPVSAAQSHTYSTAGSYTINLVANTFQSGNLLCTNTSSQPIVVFPPPQQFGFDLSTTEGCGPLSVDFVNSSQAEQANYFWDFGNGNTFVGPFPGTQIFEQGIEDTIYSIRLTLITRCDTLVLEKTVLVHPKPTAGLGFSYPLPCSGNNIELTLTSVGNPDINTIYSEQGQVIAAVLGQSYFLPLFTDSVPREVLLWVVTQNECGIDTAEQIVTVLPSNVAALINLNQDTTLICPNQPLVLRSNSTPGAVLKWKNLTTGEVFSGDSLVLTYPTAGQYQMILYAEGCGYDSALLTIRVRTPPDVAIVSDNFGCPGRPISFTVTADAGTLILFPDSTSSVLKNVLRSFDLPSGNYPVLVTATDQYGCTQTAQTQFYLGQRPAASILPIEPACARSPFTVVHNSTGASTYVWTLNSQNYDGPQFTTELQNAGQYLVNLVAISNEGCTDTAARLMNIIATPIIAIEDSLLRPCAPSEVIFTNQSTDYTDFQWRFSDNTISQTDTVLKVFPQGGVVWAELWASNQGLCADSNRIQLDLPVTPYNQIELIRHCTVDSGYTLIVQHPLAQNHYFTLFGADTSWVNTYLIQKLPASDYVFEIVSPEGCPNDTAFTLLPINELKVTLPPDTAIILGASVLIETAVNQPNLQYDWLPQADLNDATIQQPLSTPDDDRLYLLTATNSLGCQDTAVILIRVLVNYDTLVFLPTGFTPGNNDGVNDLFGLRNLHPGLEEIVYFNVFDRYGNRVFHAENCPPILTRFTCEWDGTFRGNKAEGGVYKVTIGYRFSNGHIEHQQRELLLIR